MMVDWWLINVFASFLQGASVFCIITKMITTENQVQGYCPEVSDTSNTAVLLGLFVPLEANVITSFHWVALVGPS